MLVIGREVGEIIMINDDIRIMVVDARDGVVRFGVDAPREVPVHRAEVYKRIKEEGQCKPSRPRRRFAREEG
ncbi:carbon storage regulator CsrA [Pseudomonas monteilii]|uniref:Translational regulator CsrA n=1 Tax=Pseudomonas monteilii TaxID=76759 RepID=A0A399M2Z4_9PSED|nr:carbon storage regulator CsrA [Pseudomonas monteilii]RII75769.1 carbon storage regulator CsrA [Pseudomonas monteilii]